MYSFFICSYQKHNKATLTGETTWRCVQHKKTANNEACPGKIRLDKDRKFIEGSLVSHIKGHGTMIGVIYEKVST